MEVSLYQSVERLLNMAAVELSVVVHSLTEGGSPTHHLLIGECTLAKINSAYNDSLLKRMRKEPRCGHKVNRIYIISHV